MTDTVLVTFPCSFPTPPLRSNDRAKWQATHRVKATIRQEARTRGLAFVLGHDYPLPGPVDVRLVWTVNDRRRRDSDGPQPTLKVFLDGLVDVGVLSDDRHTIVRRAWCEIDYQPDQTPGCRVEILGVTQPAQQEHLEDQ